MKNLLCGLFFLFLSLSGAPAALWDLTVTGRFERADNAGELGIVFPSDFTLHARFDDAQGDRDPDDRFVGEFYTEGPITLDFAANPGDPAFHFEAQGNDVYVYAGLGGVYGFAVENTWPFTAYDLDWPEGGIYFAAIGSRFGDLFPTDDLAHALEQLPALSARADPYVLLTTYPLGEISVQANDDLHFSVTPADIVPEPHAGALLALGIVLLFRRRT